MNLSSSSNAYTLQVIIETFYLSLRIFSQVLYVDTMQNLHTYYENRVPEIEFEAQLRSDMEFRKEREFT